MQNANTKDFWIHLALFLLVAGMLTGLVFLYSELAKVRNQKLPEVSTQNIYPVTYLNQVEPTPLRSPSFAGQAPTPSSSPTPVAVKASTLIPQKVTSYVPFSGSFSTTNTDWTDIPGTQAYVDLKNNYSETAYVTFEASLKANPGSTAHARLFDSTHGFGVLGSEVNTASTSSTLVSSGKLNLWSGNNLYKVQIKSLNSFNVTFDSGRMKLVY